MAEGLIEVDEICEHKAARDSVKLCDRGLDALVVGGRGHRRGHPSAGEDVGDLADPTHFEALTGDVIEHGGGGRFNRVVVTVGRAREASGRSREGPGDHPAHLMGAREDGARPHAHLVEPLERDDIYMSRYLKDTVP